MLACPPSLPEPLGHSRLENDRQEPRYSPKNRKNGHFRNFFSVKEIIGFSSGPHTILTESLYRVGRCQERLLNSPKAIAMTNSKTTSVAKDTAKDARVRTEVQMQRWWRLTTTKKTLPKPIGNPAADAAAQAIAQMLSNVRNHGLGS